MCSLSAMKTSFIIAILALLATAVCDSGPTSSNSSDPRGVQDVMSILTDFYYDSPNATAGLFDQSISPWWESGSIFEVSYRPHAMAGKTLCF